MTRPSETARSLGHAHGRARVNVAPEVQIEPEIETRPEQEIATCEGGLGAARPSATDTGSLLTFAEIVTAHTVRK